MPFKVELEITAKAARSLWTKTISAFNTISDNFKIDIVQGTNTGYNDNGDKCHSEILFTCMNKTKTTVLNVAFQQCFFRKFNIDGEIGKFGTKDGSDNSHNNDAKSYTIIVNSRDMNILFKDCADDTISWRIFMLCGDEISHMVYSNKLFVEFETKDGMKKKYSIAFRPASVSYNNKIHFIYLQNLEHQKRIDDLKEFGNGDDIDVVGDEEDEDERVHRFAIDTAILKNFINVFPPTLEDFKIEINPNNGLISFKGFNRQQLVTKNEAVYNKPMTLGIQVRLSQIIYHNFKEQKVMNDGIPDKIHMSFRLKNFKTFIQIISGNFSGFNNDDGDNDNKSSNRNKTSTVYDGEISFGDREDVCDVMFSNPGYPVIFERRYFLDGENELLECCSVTLTEVTDGESGKIILEGITSNTTNRLSNITMRTMNDNLKNRLASLDHTKIHNDNMNANNPDIRRSEPLFVIDDPEENEAENNYDNINDFDILGDLNMNDHDHDNDELWNNSKFHQTKVIEKILETQQTSNGAERKEGDDKAEDDEAGDDENVYLGPTQKLQIKGIFD